MSNVTWKTRKRVVPQRKWTSAELLRIEERWKTETLREISEDLNVPFGTMKSLLHRHGIKCPAKNSKAKRRKFGPVTARERDERRRWYRMYHRMRMDDVPAQAAVRQLRKRGCNLTRHQLTCGWWHYKQTLLNKAKKQ